MPRLGDINLALVSLYFVPVWGHPALNALTSGFGGFEDSANAAAAMYLHGVFHLGLAGVMRMASLLAAMKLIVAVAFVTYLIDLARALAVGRRSDRATVDLVLLVALAACVLRLMPALAQTDTSGWRLQATELLLLAGAAIVVAAEGWRERVGVAEHGAGDNERSTFLTLS